MLILAIAVLVVKHVGGRVRLESSNAERQADIAEVGCDVIIERLNFVDVGGLAFGEFGGLGADFVVGLAAVFFQLGVPSAHLLPTGESRHLNGGRVGLFLKFLLVFLLFFILVFVLRVVVVDV